MNRDQSAPSRSLAELLEQQSVRLRMLRQRAVWSPTLVFAEEKHDPPLALAVQDLDIVPNPNPRGTLVLEQNLEPGSWVFTAESEWEFSFAALGYGRVAMLAFAEDATTGSVLTLRAPERSTDGDATDWRYDAVRPNWLSTSWSTKSDAEIAVRIYMAMGRIDGVGATAALRSVSLMCLPA